MATNYSITLRETSTGVGVSIQRNPTSEAVDSNSVAQVRLTIPALMDQGFGSPAVCDISAATSAAPIVLTVVTASGSGFASGDVVKVENVSGNTCANGTFLITTVAGSADASLITLLGSKANAAYTAGGKITNLNKAKSFHVALAAAMAAILNDKAAGN